MSEKNKILIEVRPQFLEEQSSPENDKFVFAYTITITNLGLIPAKLINRHWLITDSNGKVEEVHGKGVVGEQPYLQQGEAFRYTSAAILKTSVGVMQGQYSMLSDDGSTFDVSIPRFTLSIPRTIH